MSPYQQRGRFSSETLDAGKTSHTTPDGSGADSPPAEQLLGLPEGSSPVCPPHPIGRQDCSQPPSSSRWWCDRACSLRTSVWRQRQEVSGWGSCSSSNTPSKQHLMWDTVTSCASITRVLTNLLYFLLLMKQGSTIEFDKDKLVLSRTSAVPVPPVESLGAYLCPRMSDWSQTPPRAMRWNSLPSVRAMERPTLVLPTPGGPTKQRIGPWRPNRGNTCEAWHK